jgi:hypothetical protein
MQSDFVIYFWFVLKYYLFNFFINEMEVRNLKVNISKFLKSKHSIKKRKKNISSNFQASYLLPLLILWQIQAPSKTSISI